MSVSSRGLWALLHAARVVIDALDNVHRQTRRLRIDWDGKENMRLIVGQTKGFKVTGLNAAGLLAAATLANLRLESSDGEVFSVANDPAATDRGIVTALKEGSATVKATAEATEPGGTKHDVSGTDIVDVVSAPIPPVAPALSLSITWDADVPEGA